MADQCQISGIVDGWAWFFAGDSRKLQNPTGSPCEVCGAPSVWNLKRRLRQVGSDVSRFDADSPEHPRCGEHLGPGCAWRIDGIKAPEDKEQKHARLKA